MQPKSEVHARRSKLLGTCTKLEKKVKSIVYERIDLREQFETILKSHQTVSGYAAYEQIPHDRPI